jgi:broad specificity phosphatase PhoE
MITLWFEAHATCIDNELKLSSGWYDDDLSEVGLKQAMELPSWSEGRDYQAIFTSDLQRAYKTAVPLAQERKIPTYVDARLRECNYGKLAKRPKKDIDALKIVKISEPFPDGESYNDCVIRVKDFLDYLKSNFDCKTVLIIGHRATQYGLEKCILNRELSEIITAPWSWQPGWKYELK